jgi:hypothetical protein
MRVTPRDDFRTLAPVLVHSGLAAGDEPAELIAADRLQYNGSSATADQPLTPGDRVTLRGADYRVEAGGRERLQLVRSSPFAPVADPVRVHCGYHKCLTEYSKSVYRRASRADWLGRDSFRHYFHRLDGFHDDAARHTISSVSGQALDLSLYSDIRVVRFVRDPRDLVVSGYFYHQRGAEHWCELPDPTDLDWLMVNGRVPDALPAGESLTSWLNGVSLEEGLHAELDFRQYHFDSMLAWPADDPRVRVFRYEDILGNEPRVFREILAFLELPWLARMRGGLAARRYRAANRRGRSVHIRNPESAQWRRYFTPELTRAFRERYGDVLERYGYPLD